MSGSRDESFDATMAQMDAQPDFRTGALFANRYEILSVIGRGGMGAVFKVRDREVGEIVALKVLTAKAGESEAVERFRREIRLARRVTHRNVARTYDLGDHAGMRFLTMEYVDGTSLRHIIEAERQLALGRAAGIGLQICEGLAAAHAAGVVHRDLKPANVLLDQAGRIVVIDFGIARATAGDGGTLQTMGTIGTPAYMAPEQVAGGEVDGYTDVYALGIILFEMLTGALPFDAPTPIASALARMQRPPPDPRTIVPRLAPEMAELVLQCLSREPPGRPTLAGVASALMPFVPAGSPALDTGQLPARRASGAVAIGGPGSSVVSSSAPGPPVTPATPATPAPGTGTGTGTGSGRLSSSGSLVLPTLPGDRALAVLPLRYRGPAEDEYLADGIAEELIDILSMTRGLRVSGSGATAKYKGERDARAIGADLGVDAVVDGTLQRAGEQVRISARLIEVSSGFQLWTGRFDGRLEDVLELQERMAKRIAEALRLELAAIAFRGDAPQEAVELYLRARAQMRRFQHVGPEGALELIEKCLAMAPSFQPAIAMHAIICVRIWFVPQGHDTRDWGAESHASVKRALAEAGSLAETHLAAAMVAAQVGEFQASARSLAKALEIAPTCAAAHEYLGRFEIETGRVEAGIKRVRLAVELEPTLAAALVDVARVHAMRGRVEEYERCVAEIEQLHSRGLPPLLVLQIRVAHWTGDRERIRTALANVPEGDSPFLLMITMYGRAVLGDMAPAEVQAMMENLTGMMQNLRFKTILAQLAVEHYALENNAEQALKFLAASFTAALVDADWMENCPALASIRTLPEFVETQRKVRRRADTMWRA